MAQSELGIILTMDTKDFVSEINNATEKTRELQKDLNKINKQLKFDPQNTDLLTAKLSILKKQYSEVSKNLERYNKVLQEMNDSIAKGNSGLTKSDTKYVETARYVSLFGKQLEKLKTDIVGVYDSLGMHHEDVNKFADEIVEANDKVEKSNEKSMASSVALGNVMASAFKTIAREVVKLGKDVIDTYATYEDSMQHLKALYLTSGEDVSMLNEEIAKLSVGSVFTPDQIANAMNSMAKAGYGARDSLESVVTVMKMAAASGEDTVSVSETLMATLAAFGGSISDLPHYANVLAIAANETLVDVKDLSDSLVYAGSLAGTYGYKIEDVAGALAFMSQQGIKGSQAGTALRSVIQRLANDTSGANKMLRTYNGLLNQNWQGFYDASGKMRPFVDVLNDIRSVYNGLSTDVKKNDFLNTLGGIRGIAGLSALVNTAEDDWTRLMDLIANSDDYIDNVVEVQYDSLAGDIQKMKANWDVFKIELGGELPIVKTIVQELTALLENEDFIAEAKDWASTLNSAFESGLEFMRLFEPVLKVLATFIKWVIKLVDMVSRFLLGMQTNDLGEMFNNNSDFDLTTSPFGGFGFNSGGAGIANAILSGGTTNSLNLTTQIYVNNNGTPINEAEIRRWGETITDMVSANLGRRLA